MLVAVQLSASLTDACHSKTLQGVSMAFGDLDSALLDAVHDGNASEAAHLLGAGADPNAADDQVHCGRCWMYIHVLINAHGS